MGCPHPTPVCDSLQCLCPPRQLYLSILQPQSGRPTLLLSPDLWGWKVQGGDAVQPPITRGQDAWSETRSARAQPRPAARAGAFPADAAEALPLHGPILSSDATAVSGQIPGIPSPALPGRAAAPGRGPGFSQAGGCPGPESPRPGSRASAVGGPCSWVPEPTQSLPPRVGVRAPPRPRALRLT